MSRINQSSKDGEAIKRNKNIENLIVNLRELAVDEVKFKIEIELDYGSLSLDNIKLKDLQVKDLAVNTYRKHLEISKLSSYYYM